MRTTCQRCIRLENQLEAAEAKCEKYEALFRAACESYQRGMHHMDCAHKLASVTPRIPPSRKAWEIVRLRNSDPTKWTWGRLARETGWQVTRVRQAYKRLMELLEKSVPLLLPDPYDCEDERKKRLVDVAVILDLAGLLPRGLSAETP